MEAKEKQFIITYEWLEKGGAFIADLQIFKKHFPNGGEALKVLKRCEELGYRDFAEELVYRLPPIYPPLELNVLDNFFYLNDVYINNDISTQEFNYIRDSLKVDGKLTVHKYGNVHAYFVYADEIVLSEIAHISSNIKANSIIMRGSSSISGVTVANSIRLRDYAEIFGNTKAKVINFRGGWIKGQVDAYEIINDGGLIEGNVNTIKIKNIKGKIEGNVDAYEIINDGGTIEGDVNTIKIKNINGGKVDGTITYK